MADTGMKNAAADDGIKHVVLLMLENHSFDQMLGALQELYPEVEGVTPELAATRRNKTLEGKVIFQQKTTESQMSFDPKHEHINALAQLKDGNAGFVQEFQKAYNNCTADDLNDVMGYYPLDFLPALHRLGREFTICDNWFSSLPGPTWPNRFFALTGTCSGEVLMPEGKELLNPKWYVEQDQPTIFDRLNEKQKNWRIYYYDFPSSLVLKNQRKAENLAGYAKISEFFRQATEAEADFPEFTLIEPQYFGIAQNDDHPPHNVMKAEKLIADVYNAIRSNKPLWESTLLVVLYDENGGFYDHVIPPKTVAPDNKTSTYLFNQLGFRVPALLISPRCERRTENTQFDHTSLLKYLTDKWDLGPLGERTRTANSIGVAISADTALRQDTVSFIRVSTADLIAKDIDREKNAVINSNQEALNYFADFLHTEMDHGIAEALQIAADAARVASIWVSAKHKIGKMLTSLGSWLSSDMRSAVQARQARTEEALDRLKQRSGI